MKVSFQSRSIFLNIINFLRDMEIHLENQKVYEGEEVGVFEDNGILEKVETQEEVEIQQD